MVKQSNRHVPNLGCDLCRELLDYLKREHAYGNRVTGKMLETHFSGLGYAWERESIRLGLAILFRGGAVEVTHQGRKYRNYVEPAARPPFVKNPDFRAASFSPRETLDLKVLANAARMYEEITGKDVNIEEGAIAEAFKATAAADREKLLPLSARLSALKLPGAPLVEEQLHWTEGILEMSADDCVRTLAGDGKAYLEGRRLASRMEKAATDANIQSITNARRVLAEQWPLLAARQPGEELTAAAASVEKRLAADTALDEIEAIRLDTEALGNAYRALYAAAFERRRKAYVEARDEVKGHPDWLILAERFKDQADQLDALLAPLSQRADPELDLPAGATTCRRTGAALAQLESDLEAVEAIARQVVRRVMELAAPPEEKIERVAIARLYPGRIASTGRIGCVHGILARAIDQGAGPRFNHRPRIKAMQARDLATQNFAVAEHLLQLHELFRGLREREASEPLRLAVCQCMDFPETSALRHARNEQVLIAARATAPIPPSLLIEEGLDFLLRQAVVVACTALESFFWDVLRENVLTIVRARKRGADDSLKKLTLTLDDYLSLESFENYDDRLKEIILKNFERGTLYDTSSIDRIARILTVTQFWPQIAKRCGLSETDIQKQISELIKRRNQVAHRADRPDERADPPEDQDGHGLRAISYSWAHTRVATAKTVVSAAAEIFVKTLGQLEKQLQQEEEQAIARQTLSTDSSTQ